MVMIAVPATFKALRVVMEDCRVLWELKVANGRIFSSGYLEIGATSTFNFRGPLNLCLFYLVPLLYFICIKIGICAGFL